MEGLSHNGVSRDREKVSTMKGSNPVSPLHNNSVDRRLESNDQLGINQKKTQRLRGGSEHSTDRSPLHPRHHHKSMGSTTPVRTRQKPSVEMVATVPKFSDLDENDPSSAEGLTGIFDRIRDEKKHGPKPPMINIDPDFSIDPTSRGGNSNSGCSCFRWFSK